RTVRVLVAGPSDRNKNADTGTSGPALGRRLRDFARWIARLPRGVLWLTLIAMAVHAQAQETATCVPWLSMAAEFVGRPAGNGCTLGNSSPETRAQTFDFTVNPQCNQGRDAVTAAINTAPFLTNCVTRSSRKSARGGICLNDAVASTGSSQISASPARVSEV